MIANELNTYWKARIPCFQGAFFLLLIVGIYFVHIPWNMERLNISESELGIGIFIFGVSNFFSNQITGRLIVPLIGTTKSMALGIGLISFCPYLLISAPNYDLFLLSWIPFGISVGLYVPSAQTQISLIEQKTSKIITPIYQAFYSLGSLTGALSAGYFIKNISDPKITFIIVGCLFIFSSFFILFKGLPLKLDVSERIRGFKFPEKKILIYGFMMMITFATFGIIIDWSPLWLTKDLKAPIYLGGLIIIFFNLGEIFARLFSNKLINTFNEKIVGGYFSVFASIVLAISILIFDIYLIVICVIIFGFGTANFLGIVLREGVKSSKEPLSLTVSNLLTMGFSGFIFGPALVGYSAEYFGLTFNMLALCLIWFLNSCLLIYIKK